MEVTEEFKHYNKPVDLCGSISLLKSQIQSLESEVQFLREELKEKFVLVKSLERLMSHLVKLRYINILKKSSLLLEIIIK